MSSSSIPGRSPRGRQDRELNAASPRAVAGEIIISLLGLKVEQNQSWFVSVPQLAGKVFCERERGGGKREREEGREREGDRETTALVTD